MFSYEVYNEVPNQINKSNRQYNATYNINGEILDLLVTRFQISKRILCPSLKTSK